MTEPNYEVDESVKKIVLLEFQKLEQMKRNIKNVEKFDYDEFISAPGVQGKDNTPVQTSRKNSSQPENDAIAISEIKALREEQRRKVEALEKALEEALVTACSETQKFMHRKRILESLRAHLIYEVPIEHLSVSSRTILKYKKRTIYYAALKLNLIEE